MFTNTKIVGIVILIVSVQIACLASEQQVSNLENEIGAQIADSIDDVIEEAKQSISEQMDLALSQYKDQSGDSIDELAELFSNFVEDINNERIVPFLPPTCGFMGLEFQDWYEDDRGLHSGIDIWAGKKNGKIWTDDENERGNPVFAVYEGKLYRTGSGVEICHPKLEIMGTDLGGTDTLL